MERRFGYIRPLVVMSVVLSLLACSKEAVQLQPSDIYRINFDDGSGSGVAVFGDMAPDGSMEGVFYPDNGKLYADTLNVAVRISKGKPRMLFSDGGQKAFSYEPYQTPRYEELPPGRIFRDSVYAVTEEKDVLYGQASGYWTSYPPEGKQKFSKIYFDRAGDLLQKRNCPLTMDVYLPDGAGVRQRPLFLMIHGGAFYNGDKAEPEFALWCRYFASLGYVAASINYRMGYLPVSDEVERAGYRALQDADAAVRFLVGQERYHIDPQRVFVAGTSAGAITALNLAFMHEKDRPKSSRGGIIGDLFGTLFGKNIVDEGPIDKINPQDSLKFKVRAVANMSVVRMELSFALTLASMR